MKLRPKKARAAWMRRVAVCLALLPCMLLSAPIARADVNPECAAGQHLYVETRRIAATAAADGEVTYLCNVCGQQYTEILYATDHYWGEWITDKQPTCTQPGEKHRTCTRAQRHDEYAEIPALGHDYAASVTTEPGCETQGVTTFACARCGNQYTEPIPAIGHDYEETVTEGFSCLEPGVRSFVCRHDPAHTYEEEIPAAGSHSFGEWTVEIPAGEGAEGLEARVCVRDGFRETRPLAALPVPPPAASPAPKFTATDVVLVSANAGLLGFFCFLLIPYFLCLGYIKKRRSAVERRDALRKEVEALYGFR